MAYASNNPELIIDIKYDTRNSYFEYSNFVRKTEQQAARHEQELLRISKSGKQKFRQSLDQSNQAIYNSVVELNRKVESLTKLEHQKALSRSRAFYSQQINQVNNWVAGFEASLGRLKGLLITYLGAKTFGFINNSINSTLQNLDDIKKEALQLGESFQDIYSIIFQNQLSGVNPESTKRIFNFIRQQLDEAVSDPKLRAKLKRLGVDLNFSVLQAYEALKKYVRETGDASVFGAKLAGEFRKIADITNEDLQKSKDLLRKIGIDNKDIEYIEKYNDAVETFYATVQLVIGKIFAQSSDKISSTINSISEKIANIDLEKIAEFFEFLVDSTLTIAHNLRSISQLGVTLDRTSSLFSSISNIKFALDVKGEIVPTIEFLEGAIRRLEDYRKQLGELGELGGSADLLIDDEIGRFEKNIELLNKLKKIGQKNDLVLSDELRKVAEFVEKIKTSFTQLPNSLKAGSSQIVSQFGKIGSVLGKIFEGAYSGASKFFSSIISGASKFVKYFSALTGIGKAFSSILKFLGKISGWITLIFMIYDFFDALFTYFERTESWLGRIWGFVKALGYSITKLIADIIDGLAYLLSFGLATLNLGKKVRELFGLEEEPKITSEPIGITPKSNNNNSGGGGGSVIEDDERTKALKTQLSELAKLKQETIKYINTLEKLKKQYIDQPVVLAEINRQLVEQREILADLNKDAYKMKPDFKGYDLPANLLDTDISSRAKQIELKIFSDDSILGGIKKVETEIAALRDKLSVLERFKELFDSGSDAAKIISNEIKNIKSQLDSLENSESEGTNLLEKLQKELIPLLSEGFNLINTLIDANLDRLNNELDVMQRRIDLETEYWNTVLENLDLAGAKNTAYYVKQESEKKKALEKLNRDELSLKAKVWDAEKSARISGAIMTAAQASLSAWTIIPPNPPLSIALTSLIAGTLATQLASINAQQNPYMLKRNSGGWIYGSGYTDSVPALLTPGEFVVNRQAAKENALLLERLNSGNNIQPANNVVINLNIDGNLIAEDSWVENSLIPKINKAILKGYQLGLN